MVKNCMENDHGFVMTFQKKLSEKDEYEISKQGAYVEIIDFNNLPNGLLGITVKSINKVSIKDMVKLKDGLNLAETYPIVDPEVDVHMRGGKLNVKIDSNRLFLTGPVTRIMHGSLSKDFIQAILN